MAVPQRTRVPAMLRRPSSVSDCGETSRRGCYSFRFSQFVKVAEENFNFRVKKQRCSLPLRESWLRNSLDKRADATNAHEHRTNDTRYTAGPKRLTGGKTEGQGGLTRLRPEKSISLPKTAFLPCQCREYFRRDLPNLPFLHSIATQTVVPFHH